VIVVGSTEPGALESLRGLQRAFLEMVYTAVEWGVGNASYSYMKLYRHFYGAFRKANPWVPADYVQEALRSASQTLKSWKELKRLSVARRRPSVKSTTVIVHPFYWRMTSTSLEIAVESGGRRCKWVAVEFKAHRHFLRYFNDPEWELCKELRFKVRRNSVLLYFAFQRDKPEAYEPVGWLSVDVNENSVAVLVDGEVYLLKTGFSQVTKDYFWRRRKIQSYYDKRYGKGNRAVRKRMKRYREKARKGDWRHKLARIVVLAASSRRYGILIEDLNLESVWSMLHHIKNKRLRLRIARACFLSILKLIEEYAALYGVPVKRVDPSYTSKICPLHGCRLEYSGRLARCPVGGETWHRETAGTFNIAKRGRTKAPSEPVVPIVIPREAWTKARDLKHAIELAKPRRPKALKWAEKYEEYIKRLRNL